MRRGEAQAELSQPEQSEAGSKEAKGTSYSASANLLLCGLVYENIGQKYKLEYPSTILACLSVVVIVPIYIFYWKGEWFRDRSKFAQELSAGRKEHVQRRRSTMVAGKGRAEMGEVQNEKQDEKGGRDGGPLGRGGTSGDAGVRHVERV